MTLYSTVSAHYSPWRMEMLHMALHESVSVTTCYLERGGCDNGQSSQDVEEVLRGFLPLS